MSQVYGVSLPISLLYNDVGYRSVITKARCMPVGWLISAEHLHIPIHIDYFVSVDVRYSARLMRRSLPIEALV